MSAQDKLAKSLRWAMAHVPGYARGEQWEDANAALAAYDEERAGREQAARFQAALDGGDEE